MTWQHTPYTIPLIAASAILFTLALYIWIHRRSPRGIAGSFVLLASTEWVLAYAIRLASADLSAKIFWNKLQYLGIVTAPITWFIFIVYYTGHEQWLRRRILVPLFIVPLITLLLAFTNEAHGLIWESVTLNATGPFLELDKIHGPWWWVYSIYGYGLILFGVLLLVRMFLYSPSFYRQQAIAVMVGTVIPLTAHALVTFKLNPFPYLDLTPVTFAVSSLIIMYALMYLRLADIVPMARETVVENLSDSVIVLDEENRIVDINSAAQQLIATTTSKPIGELLEKLWPELFCQTESLSTTPEQGREIELFTRNEKHTYDLRVSLLADVKGSIVSRVIVLRDITDRKRAEEEIKASLKEKEVLLQEIHHRVKNNIQIISSLLSLQSHYIKDKKYVEMLKESQNRIRSMALIHEKLYQSRNLASIDFDGYVETLVRDLIRSYGVNTAGAAVTTKVENICLNIDTAVPCGLIINELVSNALKHAFPDGRKGEITITFSQSGDTLELAVSDNGVGIPETIDFRNTDSLGLRLVTILAEDQLNGEITLDRCEGTTFRITFRK